MQDVVASAGEVWKNAKEPSFELVCGLSTVKTLWCNMVTPLLL